LKRRKSIFSKAEKKEDTKEDREKFFQDLVENYKIESEVDNIISSTSKPIVQKIETEAFMNKFFTFDVVLFMDK
jgi:hypothetical protein